MKYMKVVLVLAICLGFLGTAADLSAHVVKVKAYVSPATYKGKCPHTFKFAGEITVKKACKVKYRWKRSDNAIPPVKYIDFDGPGTKTVKSTWMLGKSGKFWKALEILTPNKMLSNKAVFTVSCIKKGTMVAAGKKPAIGSSFKKPPRMRAGMVFKRDCPDPAAVELKAHLVRKASPYEGTVKLVGVVKNIGKKAFKARSGQAAVVLYENPPGGRSREIKRKAFTTLHPNATIRVEHTRTWRTSYEFPPNYKLMITYDPDIYMDETKENDDCNQKNNSKELKADAISAVLR